VQFFFFLFLWDEEKSFFDGGAHTKGLLCVINGPSGLSPNFFEEKESTSSNFGFYSSKLFLLVVVINSFKIDRALS
jgi:hypothetical protein